MSFGSSSIASRPWKATQQRASSGWRGLRASPPRPRYLWAAAAQARAQALRSLRELRLPLPCRLCWERATWACLSELQCRQPLGASAQAVAAARHHRQLLGRATHQAQGLGPSDAGRGRRLQLPVIAGVLPLWLASIVGRMLLRLCTQRQRRWMAMTAALLRPTVTVMPSAVVTRTRETAPADE
jgi:hypothetical protein